MTGAAPTAFVHLSDPHVTDLNGVDWPNLLNKRLLGYLSWRRRRRARYRAELTAPLQQALAGLDYQQLLISGDLTQVALPQEFVQARQWLQDLALPRDLMLVPGNHDTYVPVPQAQGLGHWSDYMASDASLPAGVVTDGFPSLRLRGQVAFIGLNTGLPTAPLLATGHLGEVQLQRLAQLLEWAGARGLCRVIMLHHPPVPGSEKWRKRLVDAASLQAVVDRYGAELLLHGHSHRPMQHYMGRRAVPAIGVPAALSVWDEPGRLACFYHYQAIAAEAGWSFDVQVWQYQPHNNAFEPRPAFRLAARQQPDRV